MVSRSGTHASLFYEAKGALDDDPLASHPQGEALDVFEFLARDVRAHPAALD